MKRKDALHILNALADEVNPYTGEVMETEVLTDTRTKMALQIAIDYIELVEEKRNNEDLVFRKFEGMNIKEIIEKFYSNNYNPTPHRVALFFTGDNNFNNEALKTHEKFGILKDIESYPVLKSTLRKYFKENHGLFNRYPAKEYPWQNVDFFEKDIFNKLSEKAINQLKEKINRLGITKTENLSPNILFARRNFPRSHEPWTEEERTLLKKALEYTNDLKLLSKSFQRGENSIRAAGQKIIFESKNLK